MSDRIGLGGDYDPSASTAGWPSRPAMPGRRRMTSLGLLRILWGRKLYVLTPTICTMIGGLVVIMTLPPRYEASSRVVLDFIKPDPVTGFRVNEKTSDAYISSQFQMLRSAEVTGRVVEAMGWLQSPDMVNAWRAAPDHGDDIKAWAGRQLSFAIGGDLVPDTNIMKIKFQSTTPDMARLVADNIRTAYIEAAIAQTRDSARASATNLTAQADRERERLVQLQTAKADLERQTGIVMNDRGISDADIAAMRVAQESALPPIQQERRGPPRKGQAELLQAQLDNIDSSIVAAGRTLGPNNPQMIEMHRRRDYVAAELAGANPTDQVADQTSRRVAAITALAHHSADKLTEVSDKQLALRLMQDEIGRRQKLFEKVSERAGRQLEISAVSDANLTPVGVTTVEPAPVFPNLALILGGCAVLGLTCGALLAFMIEAIGRRVRTATDLGGAISTPLLGVMPPIVWARAPRPKVERARRVQRVRPPKPPREPRAARNKAKFSQA
jgi:uncharacterized protein involved in exopolysaccharide biosynthesis